MIIIIIKFDMQKIKLLRNRRNRFNLIKLISNLKKLWPDIKKNKERRSLNWIKYKLILKIKIIISNPFNYWSTFLIIKIILIIKLYWN